MSFSSPELSLRTYCNLLTKSNIAPCLFPMKNKVTVIFWPKVILSVPLLFTCVWKLSYDGLTSLFFLGTQKGLSVSIQIWLWYCQVLLGSDPDKSWRNQIYTIYEVFIYDGKLSYIVCLWLCIFYCLIYCISLNVNLKRL